MMKPDDDEAPSDVMSDERKIELMAMALFDTWIDHTYAGAAHNNRWTELGERAQNAWRYAASTALRIAPQLLAEPVPPNVLTVSTLYAQDAKQPMVQVDFPRSTTRLQLVADNARALAYNILGACNAAETDAFLIEWLAREGFSENAKYAMLRQFRQWREARIGGRPEHGGDPGNAVVGKEQ